VNKNHLTSQTLRKAQQSKKKEKQRMTLMLLQKLGSPKQRQKDNRNKGL
jgi:3-dehydroquinate synthetase